MEIPSLSEFLTKSCCLPPIFQIIVSCAFVALGNLLDIPGTPRKAIVRHFCSLIKQEVPGNQIMFNIHKMILHIYAIN
jgi:hypothetical protein